MILTVFDEDVGHVLPEAIRHDVLVGLHHVGAEDLLVAALRHVGPGRPGVGFQQFGAAGLRRKQKQSEPGNHRSAVFHATSPHHLCHHEVEQLVGQGVVRTAEISHGVQARPGGDAGRPVHLPADTRRRHTTPSAASGPAFASEPTLTGESQVHEAAKTCTRSALFCPNHTVRL